MNQEMKIVREVNMMAEAFYDDAEKLGEHAALALGGRGRRAQMTGLENIAESALKTSDIFDYIKKQTARFEYWRKGDPEYEKPNEAFGLRLKNYLENEIATRRNIICGRLSIGTQTEENRRERQHIYLLLIRQFIRQMVVHYEFRVSGVEEEIGHGTQR